MSESFAREPRYLLFVSKTHNYGSNALDYEIVVKGPHDETAKTTLEGPLTPEIIVGALRQLADVVEAARKPQEAPSDPG